MAWHHRALEAKIRPKGLRWPCLAPPGTRWQAAENLAVFHLKKKKKRRKEGKKETHPDFTLMSMPDQITHTKQGLQIDEEFIINK